MTPTTNSHSGSDNPPMTPGADAAADDSPEARMQRRWPQPIRVGDLVGRPVVDDDDVILGHVQQVVRTPAGKILLIVPRRRSFWRWYGWFARPVAVPIEVVVSIGRNTASVDMQPPAYASAPTWLEGRDTRLPDDETIRIAIGKR